MNYRGYTLEVHPTLTVYSNRVCFIKQGGLTITDVLGVSVEDAIKAGKAWIDWRLSNDIQYRSLASRR